jgi:hypothetical protein
VTINTQILDNEKELDSVKQKATELTRHIRKLRNYREKCKLAEIWDEELGPILVDEAHTVGLDLEVALGLVETETGPFPDKNIFGCDTGGPFCNSEVTRDKLNVLFDYIKKGGGSTGVGPTQIAHPPYIQRAEKIGGAHIARNTMRVGLAILKKLVEKYGVSQAYVYYNGGEGTKNDYSVNVYGPKALANYQYYKEQFETIGE